MWKNRENLTWSRNEPESEIGDVFNIPKQIAQLTRRVSGKRVYQMECSIKGKKKKTMIIKITNIA